MSFRIPFQISRAGVSVIRPTSPESLFRHIPHQGSCQITKNICQLCNNTIPSSNILKERKYPTQSLPIKQSTSKILVRESSKSNKENREKVRKQHKCDEKEEKEPELAFRQTTKAECECCMSPQPLMCPKLGRPVRHYDDSTKTYKHKNCPEETCGPPRMDDIKGYKIKNEKLPELPENDNCKPCLNSRPQTAPRLGRLYKAYDPCKLKYNHKDCPDYDFCKKMPRMDDIRGYKVTHKELPPLPKGNCKLCLAPKPIDMPGLQRPKQRYDQSKMKYRHPHCKDYCNIDPPRMDDVTGYKVQPKQLPTFPKSKCPQCQEKLSMYAPELVAPKRRYDPSKMKYNHCNCKMNDCNIDPPRIDNVVGLEMKKKKLPKLEESLCKQCPPFRPCTAPALGRPKLCYIPKDNVKYKNCEEIFVIKPPRSDNVAGYKVGVKKLPPPPVSSDCAPCKSFRPTINPDIGRPDKMYDDLKLKYRHKCDPNTCNIDPPRMDNIKGYKIVEKKLPPSPESDDCQPCLDPKPTFLPPLKGPQQLFDDTKMKFRHSCSPDLCDIDPPRMDTLLGLKVEHKVLPKLKFLDCKPCQPYTPTKAPKLTLPSRKFDPSTMKYRHKNCNTCKENAPKRMDNVVGYKTVPKKLPKLPVKADCKQCTSLLPTKAPKLERPKRSYDPSKMGKKCKVPVCLCDLCPPRMDDVLCWKPRKKNLPTFIDKKQKCSYSTCIRNYVQVHRPIKPKYTIYSRIRYTNRLFQRESIQYYGTRKKSGCKKCDSFKMDKCKPRFRKNCEDWQQRTCKKIKPPYGSYGECFSGFWEDPLTECANDKKKLMQPRFQVSEKSRVLLETTPKWKLVDPDLEKQCLKDLECEKEHHFKDKKWCNPCKQFKLKYCKPRGRRHCEEYTDRKCKKLLAPYESFYDMCPQFPPLDLTECDLAEKFSTAAYQTLGKKCKLPCLKGMSDVKCDFRSGEPRATKKGKSSRRASKKSVRKKGVAKLSSTSKASCPHENDSGKPNEKQICKCEKDNMSTFQKVEACKQMVKWNKKTRMGLFKSILNMLKAREGCPAPDDWKKERLRANAYKAAKAAGLEICDPKEKICETSNQPVSSESCTTACKDNPSPKTACSKPRCNTKKRNALSKKKSYCHSKNLSTSAAKNRKFSSCSTLPSRQQKINHIKKQILSKQLKLNIEKVRNYSTKNNDKNCGKTYSKKYVGKMYKLKLTKIGVKNKLLNKNNNDEEPHTICYICKVVPRHQDIYKVTESDVKEIKMRKNPEKRNTY